MLKGRRVLWVAGGSDYTNTAMMTGALREAVRANGYNAILTGAARGADLTAEEVWRSRFQLPYVGIPARWDELGEGADHARNQVIAELGPAALLALPGDMDTLNARAIARLHDIPVIE